jgi:hypothetical protein
VARFYLQDDNRTRHDFLAANAARCVVYGPHERALGAERPGTDGLPRAVYDTPAVNVYEVEPFEASRASR